MPGRLCPQTHIAALRRTAAPKARRDPLVRPEQSPRVAKLEEVHPAFQDLVNVCVSCARVPLLRRQTLPIVVRILWPIIPVRLSRKKRAVLHVLLGSPQDEDLPGLANVALGPVRKLLPSHGTPNQTDQALAFSLLLESPQPANKTNATRCSGRAPATESSQWQIACSTTLSLQN